MQWTTKSLRPISGKKKETPSVQLVQLLSRIRLSATPWIAARQASLSITNSRSSLRLTSIKSVMPPSYLILCCPLLLLPPIPPSIRVFSNESTLRMRWPKYKYVNLVYWPLFSYGLFLSSLRALRSRISGRFLGIGDKNWSTKPMRNWTN